MRTRATTSFLPGTTLATVRFPLAGGGFLADSPGVLAADQLATRLTPHELQLVQPQKVLRPVTYLLSPGRSLMLGGLGRLDVLQASSRLLATVCVGFRLPVHITQTDRVPSLLERHWGRALLQPPVLVADADDNASVERPGHGDSGVEAPWFRGPDRMATLLPRDTDAVAVDIRPGEDTVLRRDVQAWPEASHGLSVKEANRDLAAPDRVTPSLVDVVFPGLGWIALTVTPDASATLRAVTCPGRVGARITVALPFLNRWADWSPPFVAWRLPVRAAARSPHHPARASPAVRSAKTWLSRTWRYPVPLLLVSASQFGFGSIVCTLAM